MEIHKIMVVGAGKMGRGIAQVAAYSGIKVLLNDVSPDLVRKALAAVEKSVNKRIEDGKMLEEEKRRIFANIAVAPDLAQAAEADFLIEAITENLQLKQDLFGKMNGICRHEVIFASNTSCLSIDALARSSGRADRFIGMHFFNPVPAMELVEIIRGTLTSDRTCETTRALAERMGKQTVLAPNYPGFIVTRVLNAMLKEACNCVVEGAKPEDVDKAMKLGCHFPMGPFELLDLIGLDVALAVGESMYAVYGDAKSKPSPLLRNMVDAGLLGRKTGRGFYEYPKD